MGDEDFQHLLGLVSPVISKKDTILRQAVPAKEHLISTLCYLATGRNFEDLKFSACISPQLLGRIIPETCDAIVKVLKDEYMQFPKHPEDWKQMADDFDNKWQFPNCGGAMDGKHIRIVSPFKSGSFYFNYKVYCSIILLALVNANLEFIMVDIGTNGHISDG